MIFIFSYINIHIHTCNINIILKLKLKLRLILRLRVDNKTIMKKDLKAMNSDILLFCYIFLFRNCYHNYYCNFYYSWHLGHLLDICLCWKIVVDSEGLVWCFGLGPVLCWLGLVLFGLMALLSLY